MKKMYCCPQLVFKWNNITSNGTDARPRAAPNFNYNCSIEKLIMKWLFHTIDKSSDKFQPHKQAWNIQNKYFKGIVLW